MMLPSPMETIMIVGGSPDATRSISTALAEEYHVVACDCDCGAIHALRRHRPAVVIADWQAMGRGDLAGRLASVSGGAPIIALVDLARPTAILQAARQGATEILSWDCTIAEIRDALSRVLRSRTPVARPAAPFIGSSPAILEAAGRIRLYAGCEYPVLILGESGTGKELAARALHQLSPRRHGPFVGRNCAALPELLAESELFGTERGAFTDAVRRAGAFELARGGVLFLDEIGDTSLPTQAKLLRVLESAEYWPLGAREPLKADIRLISATGRDLAAAAARGAYRADLLYRIDTLILRLPPLRDCRGDIPELAAHFATEAAAGRATLSAQAMKKLQAYNWPGNVRQLRNVILRAVVHAGGQPEILEEHIQF